jgi:hypothetical protein
MIMSLGHCLNFVVKEGGLTAQCTRRCRRIWNRNFKKVTKAYLWWVEQMGWGVFYSALLMLRMEKDHEGTR